MRGAALGWYYGGALGMGMIEACGGRTFGAMGTRVVAMLGAMLMVMTIGACSGKTPAFYYLIDFDGTVEGEPFAFRTRVACYEAKSYGGTPGRAGVIYVADRMSFGKRLASGRGVFVGAPFYCRQIPKTEEPVVPLIYITDDYDNPRHLWASGNPAGPEPGSGVELKKCVMRVINPSEDADDVPILAKDMHDPFHDLRPKPRSWEVVNLLPTGTTEPLAEEKLVYTSPDGRWQVFDDPEAGRKLYPSANAGSYWSGVVRSGPLDMVVRNALGDKFYDPELKERMRFAEWAYANNLRVYVDDGRFVVDPSVHGVVDAYPRGTMVWADKPFSLVVGGGSVELSMHTLSIGHLFLYDKQQSRLFRFDPSYFSA